MTRFTRSGHFRTNDHGTTFWVRPHGVSRDEWSRGALLLSLRTRDTLDFLQRSEAKHGGAACYVKPNARCPVCDASVFFYANLFGSRVFFDDLGPPWPKHACTDNRNRAGQPKASDVGSFTLRPKGQREELIAAANVARLMPGKAFGARRPNEWTLLVVDSVMRDGEKNTVRAEFLDSVSHEKTTFDCFSANRVFDVGDLVQIRGSQICFFDRDSMSPIEFLRGGRVPIVGDGSPVVPKVANTSPAPVERARFGSGVRNAPKRTRDKLQMRPDEARHFQNVRMSMDRFCESMASLIKAYAADGTRKPAEVSARLNRERRQTADRAQWTPRLARFLLARIFSSEANRRKAKGPRESAGASTARLRS